MAVIKITTAERDIINAIATDSDTANTDGINVQPATAYAATSVPVTDYAVIKVGYETEILDGIKSLTVPMYRYVGPISLSAYDTAPNLNFNIETTLISAAFPSNFEVVRTVQVNVSFSAFTDIVTTYAQYWIEINGGSDSTKLRYRI